MRLLRARQLQLVKQLDDPTAVVIFQTAESKRFTTDQMMWQVPALSLTAQAFLLTIAYGHQLSWLARLAAACLGFITAAAAVQLLLKHRYHEELYSRWLEEFALARGWPVMHGPDRAEAFAYIGHRSDWKQEPKLLGWRVARFPSPRVWIATFLIFAATDLVVVGLWISHLLWKWHPFG